MTDKEAQTIKRPPVVTVVGHIDHGKSTLLDFIRRENTVGSEAGGITQHVSAYEIEHQTNEGESRKITFLDTPGHEAFRAQRSRGVNIADIAILIVAADDGVKEQTIEALNSIRESDIPFIVAINKIDKEEANEEKVKQQLMENEVFLEGYGGQVSYTSISAKNGKGVPELLETVLLAADLKELKGNPDKKAEGVVLEADIDPQKGITATLIIKDGTLEKGSFVVAGYSYAPVRIMQNFKGSSINKATFPSPVKIIGFNHIPQVGTPFYCMDNKKEAEKETKEIEEKQKAKKETSRGGMVKEFSQVSIPVVLKADVSGSMDAVEYELSKIGDEDVGIKIIQKGLGNISENDIQMAAANENALVAGFNVKINSKAQDIMKEKDIETKTFNVIYELIEWVTESVQKRKPQKETEESTGTLKVKKVFAQAKAGKVIGGEVQEGEIRVGEEIKIYRRGNEIGKGSIVNLQAQKVNTQKVEAENECGTQIRSKTDIAGGDILEGFIKTEK